MSFAHLTLLVHKVLGTNAAELSLVNGLEGHGGEDGLAIRVFQKLSGSAVEGNGRHKHAPATSEFLEVEGGLGVGVLSTSQEPEEQGKGEEERGDGGVHGEGAEPEDEGDDAPEREHELFTLDADRVVGGGGAGLVGSGGDEGAVEGDGHPEGAIGAEGSGGKGVFAGVLQDASNELGKATKEEPKGVCLIGSEFLRQRSVSTSGGGVDTLYVCEREEKEKRG